MCDISFVSSNKSWLKIDRNINSLIDINKVLNRIKNRDNKSSNVLEGFYDNDFWKLFMINIFSHEDKEKKKKKRATEKFCIEKHRTRPIIFSNKRNDEDKTIDEKQNEKQMYS